MEQSKGLKNLFVMTAVVVVVVVGVVVAVVVVVEAVVVEISFRCRVRPPRKGRGRWVDRRRGESKTWPRRSSTDCPSSRPSCTDARATTVTSAASRRRFGQRHCDGVRLSDVCGSSECRAASEAKSESSETKQKSF